MSDEYEKLAWYRDAAARGNLEALKVLLARAENRGDWSFLDRQMCDNPNIWREIWKKMIRMGANGNENAVSGLRKAAKLGKAEAADLCALGRETFTALCRLYAD